MIAFLDTTFARIVSLLLSLTPSADSLLPNLLNVPAMIASPWVVLYDRVDLSGYEIILVRSSGLCLMSRSGQAVLGDLLTSPLSAPAP